MVQPPRSDFYTPQLNIEALKIRLCNVFSPPGSASPLAADSLIRAHKHAHRETVLVSFLKQVKGKLNAAFWMSCCVGFTCRQLACGGFSLQKRCSRYMYRKKTSQWSNVSAHFYSATLSLSFHFPCLLVSSLSPSVQTEVFSHLFSPWRCTWHAAG